MFVAMKLINLIKRHLKSKKHSSNLNNQVESEEQNDIFKFDETLFEPTNKEKKFKCKIFKIKVYDLVKHLKSFSHEKKVNPVMRIFDEVYGPLNKNDSKIILRCKSCNEEIEYKNRQKFKNLDKKWHTFE
jgi:hypothetical protein